MSGSELQPSEITGDEDKTKLNRIMSADTSADIKQKGKDFSSQYYVLSKGTPRVICGIQLLR
jgi:hypothetical protein